jgi:hypothetical protein
MVNHANLISFDAQTGEVLQFLPLQTLETVLLEILFSMIGMELRCKATSATCISCRDATIVSNADRLPGLFSGKVSLDCVTCGRHRLLLGPCRQRERRQWQKWPSNGTYELDDVNYQVIKSDSAVLSCNLVQSS